MRVDDLAEHLERGDVRRTGLGRVGPGAHALLLHPFLETGEVDLTAALPRDLTGEIDREPERVVQEERVVAGDVLLVDDVGEHVDAALQRGAERFLFAFDDLAHDVVRRRELRIRVAHRGDDLVDHLGQHDVARAEQIRVPDRAADDAPQHVAALLVRRPHAVVDHEGHRTRVLGDDPQRHVGRLVRTGTARR